MAKDNVNSMADLCQYIREGRIDESKRIVDSDRLILKKTDDAGRCVLHHAAVAGLLPLVHISIQEEGVEADTVDDMGWTALMCASSAGKVDVLRFLIALPEVNLSKQNSNGQTALHYAASKGHEEIVSLLIENGAEVNMRDKYGATALHRAASQGRLKIVTLILKAKGVKVDIKDCEGKTPLYLSIEEGSEECAVALVLHSANLDEVDNDGKSCRSLVKSRTFVEKLKAAEMRSKGE